MTHLISLALAGTGVTLLVQSRMETSGWTAGTTPMAALPSSRGMQTGAAVASQSWPDMLTTWKQLPSGVRYAEQLKDTQPAGS